MRDYLLFIDTETSGLPKDWRQPYTIQDNWPYIVQIAWVVYSKEGALLKKENYFIGDNDFNISPSAQKIHGITREFLQQQGARRKEVMAKLYRDLQQYRPLVVGYFMELDAHMLGVGFHRTGLENPLKQLPTFCVMRVTAAYLREPYRKYLNLGELYRQLFGTALNQQHDALVDAEATARCFFTLLHQNDISEEVIMQQQLAGNQPVVPGSSLVYVTVLLCIFVLTIILLYYL